MKPNRLEAFSDGVFAVAITLLVFNLKVPEVGSGSLSSALGHQWPSYLAYLISFSTIGICWVNHNSMLDRVVMADRDLLFIHLHLLIGIVTIPFTTSLPHWQLFGTTKVRVQNGQSESIARTGSTSLRSLYRLFATS